MRPDKKDKKRREVRLHKAVEGPEVHAEPAEAERGVRAGDSPRAPAGVPAVYLRHVGFGALIYQQMVARVDRGIGDGDLVPVVDTRGEMFGWGFYNSQSQIALRMVSHSAEPLADDWLEQRVARAVQLRRDVLRLDGVSDGYRLLHAEGDGLSGLIVDKLGDYVVLELFSLAMWQRVERIQDAFIDAGLSVKDFIVRADKPVAEREGFRIDAGGRGKHRQRESETVITENGVKFWVDLAAGHKTGFFCDHRDNRLSLTELTPGRSVLDLCCYSGGFACYAAERGGAKNVLGVDLDEKALVLAERNAALNGLKIEFEHADAFDFLRRAAAEGRKWDVVVADPSKFVARRDQMELGLHKYSDLNRLAAGVVSEGGVLLTCSCSGLVDQATFVDTVGKSCRYAGREMQIFRISGAGGDHPFMAQTPQSAYLKAVWARL